MHPVTRRHSRAFTIVELLFVIFIIAIAGALAAQVIGPMVISSSLRSAASTTASALRQARNKAITSGQIHAVRIVTVVAENHRQETRIYQLDSFAEPTDGAFSWELVEDAGEGERFVGGQTLPPQVDVVFADGSQNYIIFMPDGSAWREGMLPSCSLLVALNAQITESDTPSVVTSREHQEVSIGSLSGRISVGERKDP